MKTIEIQLFKFSELSEDAKQTAINNYRNKGYDNQHYFEEIISSVKSVCALFNLKTGNQYDYLRSSHIDDNILELKGERLYKYIINNFYSSLFTPAYIGSKDRAIKGNQFIYKVRKDYKGEPYTQIFSKLKTDNSCTLTGVCYDNDILQPVYDFLLKPAKDTTFEDLIKDIERAITKTFSNTEDWLNSEEFISEELENNEQDFTEDGTIY